MHDKRLAKKYAIISEWNNGVTPDNMKNEKYIFFFWSELLIQGLSTVFSHPVSSVLSNWKFWQQVIWGKKLELLWDENEH